MPMSSPPPFRLPPPLRPPADLPPRLCVTPRIYSGRGAPAGESSAPSDASAHEPTSGSPVVARYDARVIPAEELVAFFRAVETHAVDLVADSDPQDVYAGNVVYRASNGWVLTVFNDANEFDYVDEVVASDGRSADLDHLETMGLDWRPEDPLAWQCLGIPGDCLFRCTDCGAVIPDAQQRGRTMRPPFVCGDTGCVGARQPPAGTWIRATR
jgi:hypothetical protein